MKNLVIALSLLGVLNGCATITDTQATCQSSTYTFTDMVGCLNDQVRKNPRLASNGSRAEYLAYANLLAEQVTYRQISDSNARYQLALKLAELQRREQEQWDKTSVALKQMADEQERRSAEAGRESLMMFQRPLSRPQPTAMPMPTSTICTPWPGGGMRCTTQ